MTKKAEVVPKKLVRMMTDILSLDKPHPDDLRELVREALREGFGPTTVEAVRERRVYRADDGAYQATYNQEQHAINGMRHMREGEFILKEMDVFSFVRKQSRWRVGPRSPRGRKVSKVRE